MNFQFFGYNLRHIKPITKLRIGSTDDYRAQINADKWGWAVYYGFLLEAKDEASARHYRNRYAKLIDEAVKTDFAAFFSDERTWPQLHKIMLAACPDPDMYAQAARMVKAAVPNWKPDGN